MEPYSIGSGLSDRELNAANWWVRHGLQARRAAFVALVIVNALLWLYSGWVFIDTVYISKPLESQIPTIIARNIETVAQLQQDAPTAITLSTPALFASTEGRYDVLSQASNPNAQWWASFTYHFRAGDSITATQQGYLLPQSQRYLFEGGWSGINTTQDVRVEIESLQWHRIDPNVVGPDYAAFQAQRQRFSTTEPQYTSDIGLGSAPIARTSVTLTNDSAYSYWDVDVVTVLMRSGVPVAASKLGQHRFLSNESRELTIDWPNPPSSVDETVVQASVNILDPQAYVSTN